MPATRYYLTLCLILIPAAHGRSDEFSEAVRNVSAGYATSLAKMARESQLAGSEKDASRLRSWLPERTNNRLYVFLPARVHRPAATAVILDDPATQSRFAKLRQQHAEDLFRLARRASDEGRNAAAMLLIGETLHEHPDHEQSRRAFGYARYEGAWHTAFEIRQLKSGKVWHDKFGWLPKDHVQRYEQGEQYFRGRWLPAERIAAMRSDISRGWTVDTEHYKVTTTHSHEAGVQLAVQLETLHDVWWQLFAGYHLREGELRRLVEDGRPPRRTSRPYKVVYFRDRDQYHAAMAKIQPGIEGTLGIYFADLRAAYFFADKDQDPGTLWHEATHQLFQESRQTKPTVALRDNFWIVEGIACYMESVQWKAGYATLGDASAGRLPAARVRLLKDDFYVPFEKMTALAAAQIQRHPQIRTLYSQAAGQATFLMHVDDGRYREALSKYLETVYQGRARRDSLSRATGASLQELDAEYRDFLKKLTPTSGDPRRIP